ncbi:MAG: hypothetical protein K2H31_04215, partial [Lachnospiraceae bacterium]|nr:hypothetical protein [Lachnospiraceae bacterium]
QHPRVPRHRHMFIIADNAGDTTPEPAAVTAEAIPDAFAHYTFDGDDEGYTAVVQVEDVGDNDGATFGIADTDAAFAYADGPVGQALYLDGSYGLNLNLKATNTDSYSISFWVNADRLANYGPTLQIGYDIGKAADAGNNVTWLNVTQSEWGADSAKIFPIVWSRNEASDGQDGTDCWPWMYGWDDSIHGKREWAMVTIVCSGEVQNSPLGSTTAGAQYYLNGQLVYDSQENYTNNTYFEYTWDATLAPNIMKPTSDFESYFGINYWDTVFKGFVDDLYVFDSVLTAGQVLSLYEMGNPNVESIAPETGTEVEVEEPVAVDHSDVTTTGTVVGATDCSTAFWTEFSDVVEVPSGESVTVNFKNYSDELENWHNFLVVLQNVADVHSTDANADYKEYAVCRADNWGWGAGYDGIATPECDWNWDTFKADIDGADIELTITNNGDSADIVFVATTADGATYNQSYTGIAVDGSLYYCFTVENAFIDIQ